MQSKRVPVDGFPLCKSTRANQFTSREIDDGKLGAIFQSLSKTDEKSDGNENNFQNQMGILVF
jgi:hypothetical protein